MSSMWYLAGNPRSYNLLARAFSITAAPDSNPLYPPLFLSDGDPATPWIASILSDNNGWVIDVNQLANPTLDAWAGGAPVGWLKATQGSLVFVLETTTAGEVRSGSAAKLQCLNTVGEARITQEKTFRSGEPVMLDGWMRGDGVHGGQVAVLCKETNRYLRLGVDDAASTWGEYQSLFAEVGTTYANKRRTFTVEPYSVTLRDTVTLRLILKYNASEAGFAGTAFFDDWTMIPGANGVSVHGHNAEPSLDFNIYAGDTEGSLVGQGTVPGPNPRPAFYKLLGGLVYKRIWRLRWEIAPALEERAAGEVVLAAFTEAQGHPSFGYEWKTLHPQTRNVSRGREVRSRKDAQHVERAIRLPFSLRTVEQEEIRQEWFERSWGGHHPMVLIPLDDDPIVIQGRVDETYSVRRQFLDNWVPGDIIVAESPLPTITG